jgi:hypothetical protein
MVSDHVKGAHDGACSFNVGAKANKLSGVELAVLDLHVTAAFLRPDSYVQVLDSIRTFQHGRLFDILVVEIDVAIICFAFSGTGRIGITDFFLLETLASGIHNQAAV